MPSQALWSQYICFQKVLMNRCQNIDPPYRKMISYPHVLYYFLSGVEENPHETEDVDKIVLDVISQKLGMESSTTNNIQRCHRLKTHRPRHSPVERQSPRPINIKFVSYRKRKNVFASTKKLKGSGLVLTESLTATRQAVLGKAKQTFRVKN